MLKSSAYKKIILAAATFLFLYGGYAIFARYRKPTVPLIRFQGRVVDPDKRGVAGALIVSRREGGELFSKLRHRKPSEEEYKKIMAQEMQMAQQLFLTRSDANGDFQIEIPETVQQLKVRIQPFINAVGDYLEPIGEDYCDLSKDYPLWHTNNIEVWDRATGRMTFRVQKREPPRRMIEIAWPLAGTESGVESWLNVATGQWQGHICQDCDLGVRITPCHDATDPGFAENFVGAIEIISAQGGGIVRIDEKQPVVPPAEQFQQTVRFHFRGCSKPPSGSLPIPAIYKERVWFRSRSGQIFGELKFGLRGLPDLHKDPTNWGILTVKANPRGRTDVNNFTHTHVSVLAPLHLPVGLPFHDVEPIIRGRLKSVYSARKRSFTLTGETGAATGCKKVALTAGELGDLQEVPVNADGSFRITTPRELGEPVFLLADCGYPWKCDSLRCNWEVVPLWENNLLDRR